MTIGIGSKVYDAELATVDRAMLGFEDHNIFTAYLIFKGPNWGQGEPARAWGPEALTLYLKTVLDVVGVRDWSEVKGKDVIVLRENRMIVGIAHRNEDKHLIFEDIIAATKR
jgi:hypothetical protein